MSEVERLADQLRRALAGEAWHGPAVLELLAGVTAAQAVAHPIPGAHSIWELVLHLCGTYRLVLRRLEGDNSQLTPEEDWPQILDATEASWQSAVESLRELNGRAQRAVAEFPEARLELALVESVPYTAFLQFSGLPQHDLYHAGQIALLKRALASAVTR